MKKKASEILKAALAVCLLFGAALAMIACGTNNAQESSSGTSTAEAATTAPTIVEDPKKIIDKKQKSVLSAIDLCEEQFKNEYAEMSDYIELISGYDRFIFLERRTSDRGEEKNYIDLSSMDLKNREAFEIFSTKLSGEDCRYLADKFGIADDELVEFFIPIIRFSDDYSGDYEYILESTKHINEIEDEKILDIILNCFSKALAQDQQDGAAG